MDQGDVVVEGGPQVVGVDKDPVGGDDLSTVVAVG